MDSAAVSPRGRLTPKGESQNDEETGGPPEEVREKSVYWDVCRRILAADLARVGAGAGQPGSQSLFRAGLVHRATQLGPLHQFRSGDLGNRPISGLIRNGALTVTPPVDTGMNLLYRLGLPVTKSSFLTYGDGTTTFPWIAGGSSRFVGFLAGTGCSGLKRTDHAEQT
jgi:hypothetical protein